MGRIELHRSGLKKENRLEQIELMIGLGEPLEERFRIKYTLMEAKPTGLRLRAYSFLKEWTMR